MAWNGRAVGRGIVEGIVHLVTYDISDTKERNKVIRVVDQYGTRMGLSVWLCDLDGGRRAKLVDKLRRLCLESGFVDVWKVSPDGERIGTGNPIPMRRACHMI